MSNLGSLTPQNIEDVLERLLEDLETTKEGMLWWKRLFEGKIPLHKQDEDFESRRFESRFSVEPNGRIFIEGKGQLTGALRKFLGAEDYIHAAAELLSSLNEKLSTDKSLNVRKDRSYHIKKLIQMCEDIKGLLKEIAELRGELWKRIWEEKEVMELKSMVQKVGEDPEEMDKLIVDVRAELDMEREIENLRNEVEGLLILLRRN